MLEFITVVVNEKYQDNTVYMNGKYAYFLRTTKEISIFKSA